MIFIFETINGIPINYKNLLVDRNLFYKRSVDINLLKTLYSINGEI